MQETPAAQQAFERYWQLGDARSLRLLAEELVREDFDESSAGGQTLEQAVAAKLRYLGTLSAEHGWQDRCRQRIAEEAERVREDMRKRAAKFRSALATAIETDAMRYVRRLADEPGELLAADAAALDRMAKLYFALVEQPLAERHEHTGAGGGAIAFDHTTAAADKLTRLLTDGAARSAENGDPGGTD